MSRAPQADGVRVSGALAGFSGAFLVHQHAVCRPSRSSRSAVSTCSSSPCSAALGPSAARCWARSTTTVPLFLNKQRFLGVITGSLERGGGTRSCWAGAAGLISVLISLRDACCGSSPRGSDTWCRAVRRLHPKRSSASSSRGGPDANSGLSVLARVRTSASVGVAWRRDVGAGPQLPAATKNDWPSARPRRRSATPTKRRHATSFAPRSPPQERNRKADAPKREGSSHDLRRRLPPAEVLRRRARPTANCPDAVRCSRRGHHVPDLPALEGQAAWRHPTSARP